MKLPTTKVCPKCDNVNLLRLSSKNYKICPSCPKNNNENYYIEWKREKDEPLYYDY
jgi:hypothetical protein